MKKRSIGVIILTFLFTFLLSLAVLISGINNDVRNITHVTVLAAILAGYLLLGVTRAKTICPPNFIPLLVFTLVLHIYWFLTKDKLNPFHYAVLFTEGLTLWFIIYNLKRETLVRLHYSFLAPLVIYSLLYLSSEVFNVSLLKLGSLYFLPGQNIGHNQIGNYGAVVLAYLLGSGKFSVNGYFSIFYYIVGIYFLIVSKSRSAFLGLGVAISYLLRYKIANNRWFYILIGSVLIAFFVISSNRSLLLSRPYFLQSVVGFVHYPVGVGMGNFELISSLESFSTSAHNIFLETVSGVGVFSLPFIYWGYKTVSSLIRKKEYLNSGWLGVFLALSVLFFVDLTYTIPGMFWLWFISLAMVQKDSAI